MRSPMIRALMGAAALSLAAGIAAAEPPTIKIGSFLSVTGPAAFLGDPEEKTLKLYVEKLNKAGGVIGRKLELVVYDDAGDSDKARTFAKRLIDQDKVDIIIGGTTTGTTMAALPLAEQAGVPFISLAGAVVIVEPVKKWVFKTPHTDRMACEKIFADMKARGIAKIGMIAGAGGFDRSMRQECLKVAGKYGISVVADESYGAKDSDMTAQLTKIKGAKPDAIICWGTNPGPAVVARNRAQLGLATPLYMSHGVASKKFIELAGAAAEGLILPAGRLVAPAQVPDGHPQKALLTKYVADYTKKFGNPPSTFGGHAYDALALVISAVKAGKSAKPQDIRDNLEKITGWWGTAGKFNFSAADHNGPSPSTAPTGHTHSTCDMSPRAQRYPPSTQ